MPWPWLVLQIIAVVVLVSSTVRLLGGLHGQHFRWAKDTVPTTTRYLWAAYTVLASFAASAFGVYHNLHRLGMAFGINAAAIVVAVVLPIALHNWRALSAG